MAQRKRSGRSPQAQHGSKSSGSRHDRRGRLARSRPDRRRTERARVPCMGVLGDLVAAMSGLLDVRMAFRLPIVFAGALLARGRRTAACWFRAAGVGGDWDRFYDCLTAVGKNAGKLLMPLIQFVVRRFDSGPEGRWRIAVDDSPTRRYGRHVEAANVHHNPTPGPADGPWLYGHNWVCLAALLPRSLFGTIALPLLSRLYVRRVDVPELQKRHEWKFRTKHELALELCRQAMNQFRALGSKAGFLVVFDGAYAARELIRPLLAEGAAIVTRLRRDAKLFDLPTKSGRRGRPRIYGPNRLSLAKRAGRRDGWQAIRYASRGVMVDGRCKTFLATSPLVGGLLRVVVLEHAAGNWAAYMSTDTSMSPEQILEAVSDRWAIEEQFHDVKEIWGAGEQQVRNVWSNIACWNLCGWLYALVELATWDRTAEQLVDRTDRPWDNPARRPSHADRRRAIVREMLQNEFSSDLPADLNHPELQERFRRLLALAA